MVGETHICLSTSTTCPECATKRSDMAFILSASGSTADGSGDGGAGSGLRPLLFVNSIPAFRVLLMRWRRMSLTGASRASESFSGEAVGIRLGSCSSLLEARLFLMNFRLFASLKDVSSITVGPVSMTNSAELMNVMQVPTSANAVEV
jgi:hypothetical protein